MMSSIAQLPARGAVDGKWRELKSLADWQREANLPMVDLTLARFLVHRERSEVVVEVVIAGAQVSAQQGGVRGEHGGDVDVTRPDGDAADEKWNGFAEK